MKKQTWLYSDFFHNGANLYYNGESRSARDGPSKVLGKDGAQHLLKHGGVYICLNPCKMQLNWWIREIHYLRRKGRYLHTNWKLKDEGTESTARSRVTSADQWMILVHFMNNNISMSPILLMFTLDKLYMMNYHPISSQMNEVYFHMLMTSLGLRHEYPLWLISAAWGWGIYGRSGNRCRSSFWWS